MRGGHLLVELAHQRISTGFLQPAENKHKPSASVDSEVQPVPVCVWVNAALPSSGHGGNQLVIQTTTTMIVRTGAGRRS